MGYTIRVGGLDIKCDKIDELTPVIEREERRRVETEMTLADCIRAIDACMLEMSRNGDSISIREVAGRARARAQRLLGLPETP